MTLRHMKIFICVCDENNMTKAAARLHMTQPSVSLAIHEMEIYYKTVLFERLGRRLFITEAGKQLLIYVRHIVNLNKQIETTMQCYGVQCSLRVGASMTIGEAVLINLLEEMRKKNKNAEILSEIHNTKELENMLLKDELDIAMVEGRIRSEYLIVQPFMADELVFITAAHNSILEKKEISLEDAAELNFFVRESGSGTRELFEQMMQSHNKKIKIAGVYNNAEAIKKAVIADLGVSVISRRIIGPELEQGKLKVFSVSDVILKRSFNIVYHKNKYISPLLKSWIKICHDFEGAVLSSLNAKSAEK
ncbi:LysR family transcriptional regulator [Pectinatus haikarae]|uniref:DNA-binding transcriptional LysR family regulator n=2 Tax=Pectinatus haikarae TaxID=349096 RepID=A0ABT9Y4Z9_9FIRM|nr:LysR family transcriptional regulator [Pectinatus haikarae]MDQ0202908.1 DNA-binding transcriptional LysR family regulator [Pectinatus haikarae]